MSIGIEVIASFVALFAFCGMFCGVDAFLKDRNWFGFVLIGLVLGPIGLMVTGMIPPAGPRRGDDEKRKVQASGGDTFPHG